MFKKRQPALTNYIQEEFKEYVEKLDSNKKVYIQNRLLGQIMWYDKQAICKQKKYKILSIISIILTAIIPAISLYTGFEYGIIASTGIAIFSAISTAIMSILNLCEYQKLWIEYRSNCEILKSVLYRFFTRSKEFYGLNEEKAFDLLIQTTEEYLLKEFQTWTELSHSLNKEQ